MSEACDLRWDDVDLSKRTIIVRRLKGSTDSSHYLERDEYKALGELWRAYSKEGTRSDYVFVNERGRPFGRMGIARMIERAGEAAGLPFPIHVHMLRHSTGYALAGRGMDTTSPALPRPCLDHKHRKIYGDVAGAVQGHLARQALRQATNILQGPPF